MVFESLQCAQLSELKAQRNSAALRANQIDLIERQGVNWPDGLTALCALTPGPLPLNEKRGEVRVPTFLSLFLPAHFFKLRFHPSIQFFWSHIFDVHHQ